MIALQNDETINYQLKADFWTEGWQTEISAERETVMGRNLEPLDLGQIRITDKLFGTYVKKVSEVMIPHQWKILNDELEDTQSTSCIRNFRIAAGEIQDTRKGVVFQDTDLYKWLEMVAYAIAGGDGKAYEELADEAIELIGRAQEDDGYLNTYFTVNAPERKWKNLAEGHELYTAGHLIEAAAAYYQATGKEKILQIAKKNADLICSLFGAEEGKIHGYPGHEEIELALVKLFRVTGEKKYLDTARYFIEERGKEPNYLRAEIDGRKEPEFFPELKECEMEYFQAGRPVKDQAEATGHAVRVMYLCAAAADIAEECGDEKLLEACLRIWENATKKRMYITGGIGTSGFRERFTTDYDLPNSTNYSETCASVGLMMVGQRLASATGEASFYDVVEQALYNTVLAGINIGGDRYFYVNPLEVVPAFCTEHTYMDHVKPVRQKWYSVACCPPNVGRTLASLGQYIYAKDKDSIYIHQFISSEASTKLQGGSVKVEMESELLQNGGVFIRVEAKQDAKLKVRIPRYAGDFRVQSRVSRSGFGKGHSAAEESGCGREFPYERSPEPVNGYITFEIPAGATEIKLQFDMTPRFLCANSEVKEDNGKTALVRGPMVYCLEEIDNGRLLSQIYVEADAAVEEGTPAEGLPGEVPTLVYPALRVKNIVGEGNLYGRLAFETEKVACRAVPYCLWNNRGEGEMLVWQKVRIP